MNEWTKDLPAKVIEWAVIGLLTWLIIVVAGWWKRIRFKAEGWKLEYFHMTGRGTFYYDEKPPDESEKARVTHDMRYRFSIRIFSEKSKTVGLHRIGVRFTKGPRYWKHTIFEDHDLLHGEKTLRQHMDHQEKLRTMSLPSGDWAEEDITGYVYRSSGVEEANAVWFIAESADGKKFRWLIARRGQDGWRTA